MKFYPVKNMLEAGCFISGASDGPVTGYAPLEEIEVAVTRNSPYPEEEDTDMYRWPEQAITAYQALEAYTKNVAFENYMEDKIGTLEEIKSVAAICLLVRPSIISWRISASRGLMPAFSIRSATGSLRLPSCSTMPVG